MTMTGVIATSCVVLIALLAWLVVNLRRQVRDLSQQLSTLQDATGPSLAQPIAVTPATPVNVAVNTYIDGGDESTLDATTRRVASVTLGSSLVKAAALAHGVSRALHEEQRIRVTYAFRKELRRQRKLRRRRRVQATSRLREASR